MNAKDNAEPVRVEKAFPAIITRAQFGRVGKLMRARAPKTSHPRRVGSTYLLSGLVKCKACNRALSGQDPKSGQFAYYVCQSIMKRGKNACVTPRLNARRFEQMIVDKVLDFVQFGRAYAPCTGEDTDPGGSAALHRHGAADCGYSGSGDVTGELMLLQMPA